MGIMASEGFQDYMRELGKGRAPVDNPYQHNKELIDNEKDDVVKFSDIIDKFWLLGNIKEDPLVRIYQKEGRLLIKLFDMKNREPELLGMFNVLYFGGRGEFSMTRNKQGEGNERKMQANTAWRYEPQPGGGGYAVGMENAPTQEEANFIEKMFRRKPGG
jgi:hypothetical protein